jgi:hypothetical protein
MKVEGESHCDLMVENSIAFDAINKEEVFDNLTISIVQEKV